MARLPLIAAAAQRRGNRPAAGSGGGSVYRPVCSLICCYRAGTGSVDLFINSADHIPVVISGYSIGSLDRACLNATSTFYGS